MIENTDAGGQFLVDAEGRSYWSSSSAMVVQSGPQEAEKVSQAQESTAAKLAAQPSKNDDGPFKPLSTIMEEMYGAPAKG